MLVAPFDEMLEQAQRHPLLMNASVHPFVFDQPYQVPWLRQALQHWRTQAGTAWVWWTPPR